VLVRGETATPSGRLALAQVALAARLCQVPLLLSLARGDAWPSLADQPGLAVAAEDESALIGRLRATPKAERLRVIEPISRETRVAAHEAAVTILDAPVLAAGRLELRWYLREQTVARAVHRYGNVMNVAAAST